MNQNNASSIKCPNSDHVNDINLVCFDECCKADRLYCIQCVQMGIHISHPSKQQELPSLFEHIQRIEKECENLTTMLNQQMDLAYQSFYQLIGGIRSKYQKSKQQFLNLNSKQMSSFFAECILFNQFDQKIIQKSIKDFQDSMEKLLSDLKLPELNYSPISNQDIHKSEELYQKAYKLYWNDDNFVEAIKVFDQSLIFNSRHKLSLCYKAASLKMLCKYTEAIIWADKALQVDQHHYDSLYTKAESLRMLGQYAEAIIWADKALLLDSKDCHSLYCKGDSLRQMKMFKEAMEVIENSLKINPNHFDSLWTKGKCLQEQNQYQEAQKFYEIALTINPNNQWTKDRINECVKALNKK